MSVIMLLIPVSLAIALFFLVGFVWAVRSGQYDDTETPSMRVLAEEAQTKGVGNSKDFSTHQNQNNS